MEKEGYSEFKEFYKEKPEPGKGHFSIEKTPTFLRGGNLTDVRLEITIQRYVFKYSSCIRRKKIMAESMAGLKRSCRCAEVTEANVGQEMTLMGWVQKSRNKGGIIFTDLRDRSGIIRSSLRRATAALRASQKLKN